jgi:hypothetical protein
VEIQTYVVSSQNSHDLATAVELHQYALLEVLFQVRIRQFESARRTHLLEFWLCLRHSGGGSLGLRSVGGV